ncbi:MAG: polyprenyl synthetase family protein, partial [Neisseriaceae bacterium]|nr:polyprenyl synthetase family protein [Neisseriaceae bacterium]
MLPNTPYFQNELQQDLDQVNQVIAEQVKSGVVLIEQIGNHIIYSGGKRMRPIIAVLSGKVLGYTQPELYRQAAMVEFIHTSTLLHDDVVDESDKRRGQDTANNLFGNAAAVLVGDFLYTRAFQLMVGADSMKLMKIMADATNVIAAGEVMQLMNIGNVDLSEDAY